jgi:hypothetical protein
MISGLCFFCVDFIDLLIQSLTIDGVMRLLPTNDIIREMDV